MGEFVCSGSADRTIGIWKMEGDGGGGFVRLGSISGHEGHVKCLQGSAYSVRGIESSKGWYSQKEHKQ
ncbi:hypothetical protein QJS10_CPA10g01667 [Acorus calamus]|uniref:Uncharacterized protein n=1 Tax=Acorus calamus TaxID=4465 RepID=A0AAV9DY50_ACOCL|nr:hypothetical protein QJS10_CPA10g01667 [Acorus calamus]